MLKTRTKLGGGFVLGLFLLLSLLSAAEAVIKIETAFGVGVGVAAGARATLTINRSNKEMSATPLGWNNPEHGMIAPPCPH